MVAKGLKENFSLFRRRDDIQVIADIHVADQAGGVALNH